MTVFVPVTGAVATQLRGSGSARELVGFADGPALRTWLGDDRLSEEEIGYVVLNHAGVAALLLDDPSRLVLAVDRELPGGDDLGTVRLGDVRWAEVQSLFADDDDATEPVDTARAEVRGLDLMAALGSPAVERLQQDHDLLWFAPEELDSLIDRS